MQISRRIVSLLASSVSEKSLAVKTYSSQAPGMVWVSGLLALTTLLASTLSGCTLFEQPGITQTQNTAPSVQPSHTPRSKPTQPAGKPTLYVPPAAVLEEIISQPAPIPSPSPTALPEPLSPTITPVCISDLKYLEDLTIPDGTQVSPGQQLDKRWQVENSGTCNWDERYSIRLISGPNLSAAEIQPLYPARSGSQVIIRMRFTAPVEPGNYQSAWQAHDPKGQPFGEPVFIQIVVKPTTTQ